jgi:hypothetical protein
MTLASVGTLSDAFGPDEALDRKIGAAQQRSQRNDLP